MVKFIFVSSLFIDFFTFKVSAIYQRMLFNNEEKWISSVNCQQFVREFVLDALGLEWPNNINIAGDVLPVSIDIVILLDFIDK